MSALAMILMAGMTGPGIEPERVSGETEPGLDLQGEWIFTAIGSSSKVTLIGDEFITIFKVRDEGGGKLRMILPLLFPFQRDIRLTCHYRQEKDRVVIRVHIPAEQRPTPFQDKDAWGILILRRVKTGE
jgi:hypothetical protein